MVNDAAGRPFDGITAEHHDHFEGGLHLADNAARAPGGLSDFLGDRDTTTNIPEPPEFARSVDIHGVTTHGVADRPDMIRLSGNGRTVHVRISNAAADAGPALSHDASQPLDGEQCLRDAGAEPGVEKAGGVRQQRPVGPGGPREPALQSARAHKRPDRLGGGELPGERWIGCHEPLPFRFG